jgi:8-oxo-dGTP diphosphatase
MNKSAVQPPYCYEHPMPAVTVDSVVFHVDRSNTIWVLLIQRNKPPFQGCWAFPGGFVNESETVEQALLRETKEETGILLNEFELFGVYSKPDRDPRQRTITIVFLAMVNQKLVPYAGDDAAKAAWFHLADLPEFAFDHRAILDDILLSLQNE